MSSEIETQEKSKDTQYNITHSQDKNRNNTQGFQAGQQQKAPAQGAQKGAEGAQNAPAQPQAPQN